MRAIRRHHKSRMKAKARRLYPACKRPERYADNLTACSCPMCGHRRKWRGPTMQERRLSDATLERLLADFDAESWNEPDEIHTLAFAEGKP